ncbi:hypothetical protein AX16_009652 [Volvariella volvacea WC 439]|nr:hypothetical protein AX16_009652 [Volvariella volvacea WC 439]
MAAVHPHPSRPQAHSRLRSTSDPFVDPSSTSTKPPPVPPKSSRAGNMPAPVSKPAPSSRDPNPADIIEAVRDTVTVRGNNDSRHPNGRSQTAVNNSSAKPSGRRSQSQDSAPITEKAKPSTKSRSKKGSQHADVIDRLDPTGVGPMFHHDGPFDACAPSRNRQRSKAPMYAWSARPGEDLPHQDGPYPSANSYPGLSAYGEPPNKKVDAIAEAWGIHEPEPYEEFFAGGGSTRQDGDTPASSIFNGRDSHTSSRNGAVTKRSTEQVDDTLRLKAAARRSGVPPPQPIFVPSPMDPPDPPAGSPSGVPKRSKSLMHRIRKMRDSPNVPVGNDPDDPPSSPSSPIEGSSRPTHRSQNSFLGRFGGSRQTPASPYTERAEPYVYIEPQANKELPPTPHITGSNSADFDTPASPGLGRKTSIMQKVGRVVRGTR